MRSDCDLQFLQYCENDDLRALCDILVYDNQGNVRFSENLSNSDSYLKCYPNNMAGMWKDLAHELQCYGGNTILNYLRHGFGPSYESIVYDVCKRMHVQGLDKHDTAEDMEQKLLLAVSSKVISELSEDDIRSIMDECEISGYNYTKQGLTAALMALYTINRRLFVIVLQAAIRLVTRVLIGRGIFFIGMGVMSRSVGLLCGPVGWFLLSGWTLWDIMGPAYRVTIPAVVQIAYMRVKYLSKLNSEKVSA